MIRWLTNIFRESKESIDDLEPSVVTSQVSYDTETRAFLFTESDLIPPFVLPGYLNSYLSDDLAATIIDADTRLTVSPIACISEDDNLCEFVDGFNRRVELVNVLFEIVRDCNLYGFSIHEIVGNASKLIDSTEILGMKRLDPRFVIINKDEKGRFRFFKQRPSFSLATSAVTPGTAPFPFERRLDPQSIVYVRNSSPFTSYGQSLLEAIRVMLKRRNDLLDAAVLAARNHANPLMHGNYQSSPEVRENKDDIDRQRILMNKATEKQTKENLKWINTAGRGEHSFKPVGHPTIPNLVPIIEHVTTAALVAVGLNPQSLGYSFGSSATSFESSDRMLVNSILTKQRNLVSQLQNKLYKLLPLIERETPAGEIVIRMQPPTLESLKDAYEADSIQVNVVERRWRNGSLTADEGARMLGANQIRDKEQWTTFMNSNEANANPNDPNVNQQMDAATRSLGNGKSPSNNPSGRRRGEVYGNQNRKTFVNRLDSN